MTQIVSNKISAWIRKNIAPYFDGNHSFCSDSVVTMLCCHDKPEEIIKFLSNDIGEAAGMFVFRMWRKLIFEYLYLKNY